jgi:hypothetical protein
VTQIGFAHAVAMVTGGRNEAGDSVLTLPLAGALFVRGSSLIPISANKPQTTVTSSASH